MRIALRFTLTLLAAFVALAQPAQAHEIGIRGGGTTEHLCGEGNVVGVFQQFTADPDDGVPVIDYLNNCGVNIFSLDIQLSVDGENVSHTDEPCSVAEGSFFDQCITLGDGTFKFFSSSGGSIAPQPIVEIASFLAITQINSIGPEFQLFVEPDNGAGWGRIVGVGTTQIPVPEPGVLVLLLTAGAAMGTRRRWRHGR